jgi:hypothetical protein
VISNNEYFIFFSNQLAGATLDDGNIFSPG